MRYSRKRSTSRIEKIARSRVIGTRTANANTTNTARLHAEILKLDVSPAYHTEDTTKLANTLELDLAVGYPANL